MSSKMLSVIITGDVKGALASFGELDLASGKTSSSMGSKFAAAGAAIGVSIAAGAVAAGVGLFKLGESFDEQYDKIRVGTGTTGKTLEGLKDTFKDVIQEVPTDFGKAGDAITQLAQRSGEATRGELKGLAEQMLELSRITKTDLTENIKASQDAFHSWGIVVEDQPKKLDAMFRTAQLTGVSVGTLFAQMNDAGLVLRGLGVNWDQATALIGAFGQAGVDVATVMPALSKSLATAAKEGKPAVEFFKDAFLSIQNAPDDTKAAGIAMQDFGAKAGPKLALLIREGKFSYDGLMGAIAGGKDTILKAAKNTEDFGEKWTMFKNKVLVVLEPIAMRVFNGMGQAMDRLGPIVDKLLAKNGDLAKFFREEWPKIQATVQSVVTTVEQIWDKFGKQIMDVIQATWGYVKGIIQGAFDVIKGIFDIMGGILTGDWDRVWTGIKEILQGIWTDIQGVIDLAWAQIKLVFAVAGDILGNIWDGIWGGIKSVADTAWSWVDEHVIGPIKTALGAVGTAASEMKRIVGEAWEGFKSAAETVLSPILAVINPIIKALERLHDLLDFGLVAPGGTSVSGDTSLLPPGWGGTAKKSAGGNNLFAGDWSWVGEDGPELVRFNRAATVIPHAQSMAIAGASGDQSTGRAVSGDGGNFSQEIVSHLHIHGDVWDPQTVQAIMDKRDRDLLRALRTKRPA